MTLIWRLFCRKASETAESLTGASQRLQRQQDAAVRQLGVMSKKLQRLQTETHQRFHHLLSLLQKHPNAFSGEVSSTILTPLCE